MISSNGMDVFFSSGLAGYQSRLPGSVSRGSKYIRVKHRVIGFHRNVRGKVLIQIHKGCNPSHPTELGSAHNMDGNVSVQLCQDVPGCITQGRIWFGTLSPVSGILAGSFPHISRLGNYNDGGQ